MTQHLTQKWRDGAIHRIGPLTLQFTHTGDGGPTGICQIETQEGTTFQLDWMDAEAIAFCIDPCADLWGASESDRELQPIGGERRGWLHLILTDDTERLGTLTGWRGRHFQVARIVMDAQTGEVVRRPPGRERTTDYRRAALKKRGGPASSDTRQSFINCCSVFARSRNPDLAENWQDQARGRFWAADTAHSELLAQEKEIEQ